MMRSLYSGVSGLKNHQTKMDVVGNNIANVNTTGFKRSRTTFQDLLSQNISGASSPNGARGGINGKQVGLGVSMASIDTIVTPGNTQYTGAALDMAIEGDGYFVLQNGNNKMYTRAGTFDMDTQGNIISTSNGYKVMGWMADNNGKLPDSLDINSLGSLKVPIGMTIDAKSTTTAAYTKNIDSNIEIGKTYGTSMLVYDSLGNSQNIQIDFTKSGNNQWDVTYKVPNTSYNVANGDYRYKYDTATLSSDFYNGSNEALDLKTFTGTLPPGTPTGNGSALVNHPFDGSKGLLKVGTYNDGSDACVKVDVKYDGSAVSLGDTLYDENGVAISDTFDPAIHTQPTTGDFSSDMVYPFGGDRDKGLIKVGTYTDGTGTHDAYAVVDITYDASSVTSNGPFYDNNGVNVAVWASGFGTLPPTTGDATTGLYNYKPGDTSGLIEVGTYYDENGTVQKAYGKVDVSDNAFTTVTLTTLKFDTSGRIIDNDGTNDNKVIYSIQNYQSCTINRDVNEDIIDIVSNNADPINIAIDFTNLTQYAAAEGESSTAMGEKTNGYPAGTLQTISADSSGVITGSFTNGETMTLAQVALACFNNPGGLTSIGGNLFSVSNNSGEPQIGASGSGGRGSIAPSTLEMSNVNLSDEFTDMIVTQRGFQANSRVITTTDTMLEELINLKR